ncbi:MAG: potassium channel family protein [Alphaproteobacteria bacterium]|nr:potassium channel family protein [Alphaproteobacteria bacterium]
MLLQLGIGALVVSLTIVVEAAFIGGAIRMLVRYGPWLGTPPYTRKSILALIGVTLWLLAALTVCVWIWAAAFVSVGVFDALEPAIYFSVVAFTTLGFGDITLPETWRLLSGISAANGLLLFGLSTAVLVEVLRGLRQAQDRRETGSERTGART